MGLLYDLHSFVSSQSCLLCISVLRDLGGLSSDYCCYLMRTQCGAVCPVVQLMLLLHFFTLLQPAPWPWPVLNPPRLNELSLLLWAQLL